MVEAVEIATPAVVTVSVEVETHNPFSMWGPQLSASEGSGVVIRPEGLVLTNAHVVEGGRNVTVRTAEGKRLRARVMALEQDLDLAVLQLEGSHSLPTAQLGDSDGLMLGETVVAIGNPLGLGLTVSTGVVASVRRDVEIKPGLHQSFIQTDAAINPGNSGGALVNLEGELIGINTAIRADAEGIGFAIPVNRAMKIAADLVHYGAVRAPWLGFEAVDVDVHPSLEGAILVAGVAPEGPAQAVGIQRGDLITELDGHAISSRADLNARLAEHTPGDTLSLTLVRSDRYATIRLKSTEVPEREADLILSEYLGIELAESAQGVVVIRATTDGLWSRSRLRVGDMIVALDGQRISSIAQVEDALRKARAQHRNTALFTLRRDQHHGHVELALR